MARLVEFFFDFMSPYSYLAATRVEAMVGPAGGEVGWRPCFLPAVLKATGNQGPGENPVKLPYVMKDVVAWAELLGLPPLVIPEGFPFLATQADRCALVALDEGKGPAFCKAMFNTIWRDGRTPDEAAISDVLGAVGLDAAKVHALASSQPLKDRLRANTDEAVRRGAFGVPAFFVGDELFMGNDRLDFVVRALARS
ncbi:MAG: 2-hydroxychromene-2-carboxylate isomerase [Myxococcaceae bacterium]|nr:2-hydroxychromene-2-carboxylate isomerase [Myxococcaceae bacterium]